MDLKARGDFLSLFRDTVFVAIPAEGGGPVHSSSLDRVLELNSSGAWGAYFTVNGFARFDDGAPSRKKADVTTLNANFLDIDLTPETRRVEADAMLRELRERGLPPTAVVLTGKGLHVYWVYREPYQMSANKLEEYEALQDAIVSAYEKRGADRQARDAARVLRLPGTRYFGKDGKLGPDEVELLHVDAGARYTASDMARFFAETLKLEKPAAQELSRLAGDEFDLSTIYGVRRGQMHGALYSAAMSLIQSSRSMAHARRLFMAALTTWEQPVDMRKAWAQFDSARLKIEKERPQVFIGDPEASAIGTALFEDIEERAVEWLWPGFVAAGKSHMLTGDPGLGKSQVTLDLAARLSTGAAFPSYSLGAEGREPMGVVILSAEDDAADTIRPRLRAAGADLRMVVHLSSAIVGRDRSNKPSVRSLALREDAEQILKALSGLPFRVGLIVIDPISAFLSSSQDSNSNSDARGTLAQLQHTVMDRGIAMLMINHNNKNASAKGAHMRSMGSVGWNAAARATFYVFRDREDEGRRVFSVGKMNLAKDSGRGFFFRVRDREMAVAGRVQSVPYVEWDERVFPTKTADEYTQAPTERREAATADCEAELGLWMAGRGEVRSTEPIGYMKERGFSQAEIYRAAKKGGFLSDRYGVWKGS